MAESKEHVTETDLRQQVDELRRSNALLQTENEMFESFLSRLDSLSLAPQLASQSEKGAEHGGNSESSGMSQEPPNLLKLEQKYFIAVCELEEMRKESELKLQDKSSTSLARNTAYYKAALEDSDMRLAEIKKERHDFQLFVAKTQKTTQVLAQRAQKVIRYMEHKIKAKKAVTERMRRKNAFLRMQNKKQQRVVQEQMQDTFSKIDLEYLKQKCVQFRESLQQLQEILVCRRMEIRKSQHTLNVYKERLKREIQESKALSIKIASHEEKLSKIRERQQKVEKEQAQAETLNKKLTAKLANFHVPDVMKYVEAKATTDRLRQTVKGLEREARIAETVSKTKKRSPEGSSGAMTTNP